MQTETINVNSFKNNYQIIIGSDIFTDLADFLKKHHDKSRFCIICDSNVSANHLLELESCLRRLRLNFFSIVIGSGEKIKSFTQLMVLSDTLLAYRIERDDLIICLGGGVVCDIGGFCAAIILRGIRYINVPTTLLAQVDAAIGGKTGINSANGKNLIGAFHQPSLVLSDISTLASLPERHFLSGYAEIVKYALIKSSSFFTYLDRHLEDIIKRKKEVLLDIIARSARVKSCIVENDPHEKGERAILNFGHSFAHALEAICNYQDDLLLHGEAVALGCVLALRYSLRLGVCDLSFVELLEAHLRRAGFIVCLGQFALKIELDANQILQFIYRDKKNKQGQIRLILSRSMGSAFVFDEVDPDDLVKFLHSELQRV